MASDIFGWCGKILKVELSSSRLSELRTMDYADRFLGGRGLATRIYWEEVGPDVGALNPENRLIFMTGPLTATGVQGASRFEVVSKSPMLKPEGFCYGNLGGYFGPFLKKAGYDGLVITGRAERPSYLFISDGQAEIKNASRLWGKGVHEVQDLLKKTYGKNIHFVTTGPAGENRCRAATLITDLEGSATGGFGAVLGSKNLKAIVVAGRGRPVVAHPEKVKKLNRLVIDLNNHSGPYGGHIHKKLKSKGRAPCFQCGLECLRKRVQDEPGHDVVRKCQASAFYLPWVETRPEEPLETVLKATHLANDFSLCTVELVRMIRWLEDCHRSGCLTEKETGLDLSQIGSLDFIHQLINMVSRREDFGEILAEGLLRAGDMVGGETRDLLPRDMFRIGGVNGSAYSLFSLLSCLEPRQPNGMIEGAVKLLARWLLHQHRPELSPVSSDVFRLAATKFWGSDQAWDLTTYEGKALASKKIQDRIYAVDSLVLCSYAYPVTHSFNAPDGVGDPSIESRLFSAVTGINTDEAGLHRYSERIFNLQRAILLREGRRAKESDVPEDFVFDERAQNNAGRKPGHLDLDCTFFFFNPRMVVPGPGNEPASVKGILLDRGKFNEMRAEYYELRGWDPETGLQKQKTLENLDLSDVAQDLKARGLVKD